MPIGRQGNVNGWLSGGIAIMLFIVLTYGAWLLGIPDLLENLNRWNDSAPALLVIFFGLTLIVFSFMLPPALLGGVIGTGIIYMFLGGIWLVLTSGQIGGFLVLLVMFSALVYLALNAVKK